MFYFAILFIGMMLYIILYQGHVNKFTSDGNLADFIGMGDGITGGGGTYIYYADANKRYPYETNAEGNKLLKALKKLIDTTTTKYLKGTDKQRLVNEGRKIYREKINLDKRGVDRKTWSQDEYLHIGFLTEYIKYKSVQRFTEMYTTMERVAAAGPIPTGTYISLGGGPGYELAGIKAFLDKHIPNNKCKYIVHDLNPEWEYAVTMQDFEFKPGPFDMVFDEITPGNKYVFVLSYVYYQYVRDTDLLQELVKHGPVLIIERIKQIKIPGAYYLIDEHDSRQVIVPGEYWQPYPERQRYVTLFPNVPYLD